MVTMDNMKYEGVIIIGIQSMVQNKNLHLTLKVGNLKVKNKGGNGQCSSSSAYCCMWSMKSYQQYAPNNGPLHNS